MNGSATRRFLASVAGLGLSALLGACLLWGGVYSASASPSLLGDANCDGRVNSIDASVILQLDAGLIGGVACPANADVNGDGHANSLDASIILQFDAGLITHIGLSPTATSTRTRIPTFTPPPISTPTDTPLPGDTATPTHTPIPATSMPTPTPQFITFGNGTKIVGTDVPAGTYRTRTTNAGCYWARLSGFGGTLDEIIANNFTDGPEVVTIAPTDLGFQSNRCATWTSDLSAITSGLNEPFGYGTFIVRIDIAPGTWSASSGSTCYWARFSGFGGTLSEIIANDFGGATIVTIDPSDAGFHSSRCGTWTKIS